MLDVKLEKHNKSVMETEKDLKHKIHYFCREKYYQTVENIALEGSKKFPDDLSFKLYSGFALVLSNRFQEGIRELEPLQNSRDVNIGALLALITAHKSCQIIDKEAIVMFDSKLKTERKNSSDYGLYYGALFHFFNDKIEKSREYLDRHLKHNQESVEGLALKGWIEILSERSSKYKIASQSFHYVLEKEKRNMDAVLGQIKLKEVEKDFDGAVTLLNQLIVKFPNALPPLIEKMKMQLASSDWDQTIEIANRILMIDSKCLEALRVKSLVLIVRDGNFDETAISLRRFFGEIEKVEPKNANIFLYNAQLFSFLSGKNLKILSETYRFAEKAAQLEPSNVEYITELGYQNLLQGKIKEATKFFKNTTKLDDSSVSALCGLTLCQIYESGVNEQIKQHVEFLREIQNDQPTSELLLMSSKIASTPQSAIMYLNRATDVHFSKFKKYPYGVTYLYHLNPGFLMDVVKEYLKYAPPPNSSLTSSETQTISETLSKSIMILEEITMSCPGLLDPQYEYAHVQYLTGNIKGAKATLAHILDDLDATSADAHILMAQIHLHQENYQQGAQSLEVGLSYNFKIREHPLYHLINAMVHKQNNNVAECISSLKSGLTASNVISKSSRGDGKGVFELSLGDKVLLFLELANAYQSDNQVQEASKVIQDAIDQFQGTSEEGRVVIANADLSVRRGNINHAIQLLQNIQPGESYYAMSKKALADIYLVHKKDRDSFAQCYKDLVETCPNAETYVMLGDAYMSIQEADKAIEAYEEALKSKSKDVKLICKMGKALVQTHHFSKAINYYKEAVKNEANLDLTCDLAELYFKLGQLDNAERVIVAELENGKVDTTDLVQLSARTKILQLLAQVRDKSGNLTESLSALKAAKENHSRVEKRILSQSDEQKDILSKICSDMAVLMTRLRDFNGAIKCYKESLTVKPGDPKVLVALSRLYMQVNDLEECQLTSKRLLAADPNSEPAIVMLADLAFRKVDFETAAYHFKQLLNKCPTYWTALARLTEVMRRTGNLEEMVPYLERAENALLHPDSEAGYSFCKGLFEWYSGRPTSGLHHFNRARRDSEWGQQAIYNMIEICLNPDSDTLGGEAFSDDLDDEEIQDSKEMALRTAQRLLAELKPRLNSDEAFTHRLLENFWLLATKQKSNVEKALQDFISIASQDIYRENAAVALGLSTAYMLQKQSQKARNQLKRIFKNQWTHEDAEYLERSWLLLTDIYIQSGKMDLPADLIQRILQHNKSCYKAYEYAGYIAEKEQLYKDAAVQYENAWKYGGQSNPSIGYKLAFNYLKGKRYADAIDVCHTILKLYPDYPRIQKDILEKARINLRT